MADEEIEPKEDAEEGEGKEVKAAKEKGEKGPIKLLGAIVGVIVVGIGLAFMAIPGGDMEPRFQGPNHFMIFEEKINTNLKDNDQRRYLQMTLDCMYFSYETKYLAKRTDDPLYAPMLMDAVGRLTSSKTLTDVYEGPARETYFEELRDCLDTILFPVHIGNTNQPLLLDEESGLRPGISASKATFRGRFADHVLKVDAIAMTLQLDKGPVVTYGGGEEDLAIYTLSGDTLFVDLTEIDGNYVGEVQVGVKGKIRQLFAKEFIAQ